MPKKITMSPEEHAALRARLEAMSDDDFTILVTPGPAAPDPAAPSDTTHSDATNPQPDTAAPSSALPQAVHTPAPRRRRRVPFGTPPIPS